MPSRGVPDRHVTVPGGAAAGTTFDSREYVMHEIVASMRFPGPDYYEVLQWLHQDLKPESYLEIGVWRGRSLALAAPPTIALGIDPCTKIEHGWTARTQILPLTSSEFFAKHRLKEFFGSDRFSLAFVDGLHQFEQAIEDVYHLESYAGPGSLIAVHDTIPLDEKTSARERRTMVHMGDVWKILPFLKEQRPDLDVITVRTGPSGLTLIRRLNPSRKRSEAEVEAVGRLQELPWGYYQQHRKAFLQTIPNDRNALLTWLSKRV